MANVSLILKAVDQASKVIDKVGGSFGKFTGHVERNEKAYRNLGLAGAGVVTSLALMTKGAETQRKTQRVLATAVENAGVSWDKYGDSIEETIAAQQRQTAVSDEDQRRALTRLVPILGSVDKAMAALPAVMDAAATSGASVETVAGTLGRALGGAAHTAESVGITFDATATFSDRLALTLDKVGGAAAEAATPSEHMRASLSDLSDSVGTALLPVMERLASVVQSASDWFTSLGDGTQETIVWLVGAAGLTAALGLVVGWVAPVVAGMRAIALAMRAHLVASGIGIALVALGALATSLGWFDSEEEAKVELGLEGLKTHIEGVGEGADTAATGLDKVPSALDRVEAALDDFAKTSRTVTDLFERKFGELPEAVAKALDDMGVIIETETGALEDSFSEQMAAIFKAAHDALGEDIPEEFEDSFKALDAAWKKGPLAAVKQGREDVKEELDEIPRDTEDMVRKTSQALATQWEPVASEIASPVVFSADRAIAAIDSIPSAAAQAVSAAQGVIDQGTKSFGLVGKSFSVTTSLGTSEQVKAAIAATKQQIQNLFQHPAGVGDPIVKQSLNNAQDKLKSLTELLSSLKSQGLQFGGIVSSPLQIVGERGPELARFPRGTRVSSAFDSRQAGGGGGFTNYGSIRIESGSLSDQMLMDILADQT